MKILRALALAFVFGIACNGGTDLTLDVTVPGDLVSKTKWFEVAAYRDTKCKALGPMLASGLPEGLTARAAFEKADKTPPVFGRIPDGQYAFAAVARDKDCAVLARGCTEIGDVSDESKVTINLQKAKDETGKCSIGTSCQAARCVPANDNADPSVGANCSLELVGGGPLLHIAEGGALMSAPAIAATSTGFVIAYRESAPGGAARLILLPVDASGGLYGADKRDLAFEQVPILQQCDRQDETDGIGMVMMGDEQGLLLIANSCGDVPNDTRLDDPNVQNVTFDVKEDPQDKKRLLATPRRNFFKPTSFPPNLGAARAASGGYVVYTESGNAKIAQIAMDAAVSPSVGGTTTGDVTDAWIASSNQVLSLLTLGGAVPVGDGGFAGDRPTLNLFMGPAGSAGTLATGSPVAYFPGTWASIAAVEGRVIVASDGAGSGESVSIRAFDLNNKEGGDETGFSVEGETDVTAGDVTVVGNRAFFAALKPGNIELHAFDNATTKLTPINSVSLKNEPRISGIKNVGDGRVAVAASTTRVAVAWTTKKQLDDSDNDPAGGYAVFACTQ